MQFYSEQVVYLPDSYQANDSRRTIADNIPDRADCGLPPEAFVFCNFNAGYKLTPSTFAGWMRILNQTEGSVLWLLAGNAQFSKNLRSQAERQGVDGARILFAPVLPVAAHLARLTFADLFLDGLPCNAHTTASDALWAGVPLVTCLGATFPGGVGASLLAAVGLPELVTKFLDAYESLAVKLAHDSALLSSLRKKLARNRLTAPLFDTARFTRHLELAFARMWDIHMRGESPRCFSIEA